MPFHNNDLCEMVQALQLEEHDHPTYIPVPLSSIHLGVRVVNFTAQVEVIIASGIIASRYIRSNIDLRSSTHISAHLVPDLKIGAAHSAMVLEK